MKDAAAVGNGKHHHIIHKLRYLKKAFKIDAFAFSEYGIEFILLKISLKENIFFFIEEK